MTKIILSGCNGHMGQVIARLASTDESVKIVLGCDINTQMKNSFSVCSSLDDADAADAVKASNILSKRIVFTPGKIFHRTLDEMSVTRSVPVDTDYTDGSSNGGNNSGGGSGNGGEEENPLG